MIFEKNTTREVVKFLCSNQARSFFIQKGNILFRKIADLLCVCLCLVRLVALLRIFAGVYVILIVTERVLICYCNL